MTIDVLTLNAHTLSTDFAANRTFNRVIEAIRLDRGLDPTRYREVVEDFHRASTTAGQQATVGQVLRAQGVSLDAVVTDVRTLEAADRADAEATAATTLNQVVDGQGHVMLDSSVDVGRVLSDPAEFERRYHSAKQLEDAYADPVKGRERWREDDRMAIDLGYDLLATMQAPLRRVAAEAPRRELKRQLDRAHRLGGSPAGRKKMLDSAVADYNSGMKLLDRGSPGVTRRHGALVMLDRGDDGVSPEARLLDAQVKGELDRRGLGWDQYLTVLDEVLG